MKKIKFNCIVKDCNNTVCQEGRMCNHHARSGKNNPMYGKKHSAAAKCEMSKFHKNKQLSDKHKENLSKAQKQRHKNFIHPMLNKKHTADTKKQMSLAKKGEKSYLYVDGRTPLVKLLRSCLEYKSWRNSIFKKDNYSCVKCSKRGGDLEAHHKKEFYQILNDFLAEYDQFSPIEDKETLFRLSIKYKPFWDVDNGITLCKDCHNKTKIGKIWKNLIERH